MIIQIDGVQVTANIQVPIGAGLTPVPLLVVILLSLAKLVEFIFMPLRTPIQVTRLT